MYTQTDMYKLTVVKCKNLYPDTPILVYLVAPKVHNDFMHLNLTITQITVDKIKHGQHNKDNDHTLLIFF